MDCNSASSARRAAILLTAAIPALPATSEVRSWDQASPTGLWSAPTSWTSALPPAAGDEIHLNSAGADPFAGIFDLPAAPQYGDRYVQDQSSTGASEFKLTIANPALTLKVQNLYIGDSSTGRIVQSDGAVSINHDVTLGDLDGTGIYELTGGTVTTNGGQTLGGERRGQIHPERAANSNAPHHADIARTCSARKLRPSL